MASTNSLVFILKVATDPESTPEGFCVFLSDPKSKMCNKPDPVSLFISAVAGVCLFFINVISKIKPLLIFGCIDGSQNLNRSQIAKFEKFSDGDSKLLEQERSLKM